MVHLLHRLYGVDTPVYTRHKSLQCAEVCRLLQMLDITWHHRMRLRLLFHHLLCRRYVIQHWTVSIN